MPAHRADLRELLRSGRFNISKQGNRLPAAAIAAYRAAGGGRDGCAAALEVLDAVERLAEDDIDELWRAAWCTNTQLLALKYGSRYAPDHPDFHPDRAALIEEVESARAAYRALVAPEVRGQVSIPDPPTDGERKELEAALWSRIRGVPDRES